MRPHDRKPFAKRSLGQNFLNDSNYIRKIIDAVGPKPNDLIVEIGPGRGALTEHLVTSGANVTAIELDTELAKALKERVVQHSNLRVFEQDVLEVDFRDAAIRPPANTDDSDKTKLVANLPYNISTAILQRLAEQRDHFLSLVLMFQKEVVDRITATPGNSERGFLTVIVEAAFSVEKLFDVPPTAFTPVPKVWSSVVRLTPKLKHIDDEKHFRKLVSDAFDQKRKTILNNLKEKYPNALSALESSGIDPKRRAETLTLSEWVALHEALRQN